MIITSLLDQDFYKFTMGQVAFDLFSNLSVEYKFKCRNKNVTWSRHHYNRICDELEDFSNLRFKSDELEYLKSLGYFKDSYLEFLRNYSPNHSHLHCRLNDAGELDIVIKGPWYSTIYWEVPLLATINQVYFEENTFDRSTAEQTKLSGKRRLINKIGILNNYPFKFVDFGTRRRYSKEWHEEITRDVMGLRSYAGTSNVYLAKKYSLTPIGTMAHEFLQVGQAVDVTLKNFQRHMLQVWSEYYRGKLSIALTDVIGIDAFLNDFDLYFAKLYDGLRHDSGDPEQWADRVIDHYKSLGIDPKTKKIVFSDGLDFHNASRLSIKYSNQIDTTFGIGTNFTNDFDNITPLQIVMKIVKCDNMPVAKISDSPGKCMCDDEEYLTYLRKVFNI